ncbi:MAG TPA: class I SAM-dependent methyltransferase [Bacteroidales bacterium]
MRAVAWMYFSIFLFIMSNLYDQVNAQESQGGSELDKKVQAFLNSRTRTWHDWNVPASDGKLLFDLIVKHKYKRAVEIGTSTGHSGIWMAWALSKTGGKLITIEIDEGRYKQALANFEKAGVAQYIDARLADAHDLIPQLKGPFDFVFCDADKDWYINYFNALDPKLVVGGCFTAHNVGMPGVIEYYDYVSKLHNYKTTTDNRGAGMAISYKTAEK